MAHGRVLVEREAALPTGADFAACLLALHVAVRLEEEGLQFYMLNANRVRNPRGRAMFHVLVRDQHDHLGWLRDQLTGLRRALGADGPPPERSATENPVFSHGRTLGDRDIDERAALRVGIAIEWESHAFYDARSEAAEDAWSRRLYADLAREERGQHERLVSAYEAILLGR